MVDANHIIKLKAVFNPFDPPLITGLLVILPVIQRVAPELSCRGKCIRRASCHSGRFVILIKLEHLGRRPCIRTVKRHIDRDIADDLNAFLICVGMKFLPLLIKFILLELVESDFFCQFFSRSVKSCFLSVLERRFPLAPAHAAVIIFYCHIQTVVIQPEGLLRDECHIVLAALTAVFTETVVSFFQRLESGIVDFLIVDALCLIAEIIRFALFFRQKSFSDESL